jgi:hypothetical protein
MEEATQACSLDLFCVSLFDFLVAPLVVTTTWENYYSLVGNQ